MAGFIELPAFLGNVRIFSGFLRRRCRIRQRQAHVPAAIEAAVTIAAGVAPLIGLGLACDPVPPPAEACGDLGGRPAVRRLGEFLLGGWGFDWLYDRLFVRPILWLARSTRATSSTASSRGIAAISRVGHYMLSFTQTGRLRWYAAGVAAGAILVLAMW